MAAPKRKRLESGQAADLDKTPTNKTVKSILGTLAGLEPAQQNDVIRLVISELRIERLTQLQTHQENLTSHQNSITELDQAVQSGLTAQMTVPQ